MRTQVLIGIVVAAHVVAVGSVLMIQGCGTVAPGTSRTAPVIPEPVTMEPLTPEAVPDMTESVPEPEERSWTTETTSYVVRKGDSLSVIAKRYGLSVAEISALNGIANPNLVREGQKIVLPGKIDVGAVGEVKTSSTKPAAAALPPGAKVYVVKKGDTLSGIAKQLGVTTDALRKVNSISGDKIFADQKLAIPDGSSSTPAMSSSKPKPAPALSPMPEPTPSMQLDSAPVTAPSAEEAPVVSTPAPTAAGGVSYREYAVEGDEDLYSVAMMWGVSVADIKALNNLRSTDLEPGQKLKIPLAP
jgi:LysM repeat protein